MVKPPRANFHARVDNALIGSQRLCGLGTKFVILCCLLEMFIS